MRSPGFRFLVVGLLILAMFIPLMMVSDIVNSRRSYSQSTVSSVGAEWGGPQLLSGPQVMIPVREAVQVTVTRDVVDPVTGRVVLHAESGQPIRESFEETRIEARAPVFLYPDQFDVALSSQTQLRHRGIFQVPVYQAEAVLEFTFPTGEAESVLRGQEELIWDEAALSMVVTANRALRGEAVLEIDGKAVALEPKPKGSGIQAALGDPQGMKAFRLSLGLNGAEWLQVAAVGRTTRVTMQSDWPDPSFQGAFLPDGSDISEIGFSADWTIPHLARNLPQVARENHDGRARADTAFGVAFYQPNDFYQKAWRAARYGILFVGLTFLTVLLIEGQREKPVHPVQYILIGLAQATFTLLMLAYAEQIGFGPAYLLAAGATIAVLVMFGAVGLKLGKRTWVLGAMLVVLYAVLFLILYSTDYALIAGSTLAFLALAATMFVTRNEEWYGPPREPGQGWFGRRKVAAAPAPAPAPAPKDQQ
ncbi:cell envelope integrity protein CreD [Aliiroseovarius subalbicans]|uniref:cell envelope integrity protein CreD n=1 Tax=Aliiroseovarius subalbicans TaxID=2925840 RepID=UPI001F5703E2|nr:cell envelope integrity protein CreD [Aliiroseovarius subalbicans]MCI2400440.1 cell envelope integrity protein CreD [Aliiroseovarius subalbicans]